MSEDVDKARLDRRELLGLGAGAVLAAGLTGGLADAASAEARRPRSRKPARGPVPRFADRQVDKLVVETVHGPVKGADIPFAMGHEHVFGDLHRVGKVGQPWDPAYMDVDWADVTAKGVETVRAVRDQGVGLWVDWTPWGVGRSVQMTRDVARQTGMKMVVPTGIYKDFAPPEFTGMTINEMAERFYRELMYGCDGLPVRAGFIKIAITDEKGPNKAETRIHRAAARAARRAGATIAAHAPFVDATMRLVRILEHEGFDLQRFVWGHPRAAVDAHIKLAKKGATIAYDEISINPGFWGEDTSDEAIIDRIQRLVDAGLGDRVMATTDDCVVMVPQNYERDCTHLHRTFAPKLRARLGEQTANMILRDNVIWAFRRGSHVR